MAKPWCERVGAVLLMVGLGLLLTGCATKPPPQRVATLQTGLCKSGLHTPHYEVKGLTQYDQDWVDETTERLVGACHQPRPQPRPKEWTTHEVAGKKIPVPPPADAETKPPAPAKKKLWDRIRGR